jgi:chromosome segregation ATPase
VNIVLCFSHGFVFFQVDLKTLRENEDRQKARIEALTKQVADERQAKEESERQLAVKLKALTFAEKKLERVDQVMTEAKSTASKREIALQQSIDAKSLQLEQLNALCASQQNRLEVLSQEMEGRGAEFASKVAAAEARNAEVTAAQNLLKGEIKKLTQELDAARIADLEARQRNDEQLQQKEAELREAKNKFDRDIAKLEQAVAAIQSGRGRLEQLQELQSDHAKKEQEFQEKIAELTEQVESLSAENEALAESNAAMVAAMEGAGAEVKEALGSRMDTKSWEERVKKLEGENAGLQEQGVMLEKTKEQLEGQIEGLKRDLAQRSNTVSELDSKLKVALGDAQFKGEALETTQKTMNSMIAETKAKVVRKKFVLFD